MVRWLDCLPGPKKGTCALTKLDDAGATLSVDADGLGRLLDELYSADLREQASKALWKRRGDVVEPARIGEREVTDGKGKSKKEKVYYYEVVVPRASLLIDLEPATTDGATPWTKLWRDVVWGVLRGVPATREAFNARAEGRPAKDIAEAWAQLAGAADRAVDLSSTYYLGAQDTTAEGVSFKDRPRHQFLLHFWPYTAQFYVPRITKAKDGETEFSGYAVAIPDVATLETFCDDLTDALKGRASAMDRFRPREAVIDLPAESALDVAYRIRNRVRAREGSRRTADLVLGFEVIHLDKEGNSVRIYSIARVEPERMLNAYVLFRSLGLRDPIFRRQRLENLIEGRRWYAGFDRLVATLSQAKLTIGSATFRHDARVSFDSERKHSEETMTQGEGQQQEARSLEEVIYLAMQSYVSGKLASKYDQRFKDVKDDPKRLDEYGEKKRKIAKDAFLAVRSRTPTAFASYFTGTLCSVKQYLSKEQFLLLSQALQREPERMRTLTLLALSAVS